MESETPQNDNRLVYLAFKSESVEPDSLWLSACAVCRNKTFTLLHDSEKKFPVLRCAACGQHLGRMGWAPERKA
jgi:hypothetical protein